MIPPVARLVALIFLRETEGGWVTTQHFHFSRCFPDLFLWGRERLCARVRAGEVICKSPLYSMEQVPSFHRALPATRVRVCPRQQGSSAYGRLVAGLSYKRAGCVPLPRTGGHVRARVMTLCCLEGGYRVKSW